MRLAVLVFVCSATATAADPAGVVEVQFKDPERFLDVGFSAADPPRVRAGLLKELGRYIERDAAPYVPAGMRLAITVTEVDMAGAYRQGPGGGGQMRVIHENTPPRIDLAFVLRGPDGAVVREGRRELRNPQFMFGSPPSSAPLRHERGLVAHWLEREFATAGRAPPR